MYNTQHYLSFFYIDILRVRNIWLHKRDGLPIRNGASDICNRGSLDPGEEKVKFLGYV